MPLRAALRLAIANHGTAARLARCRRTAGTTRREPDQVNIGLNDEAKHRLDDLIRAIDANTAAIERRNELDDQAQNGPRG